MHDIFTRSLWPLPLLQRLSGPLEESIQMELTCGERRSKKEGLEFSRYFGFIFKIKVNWDMAVLILFLSFLFLRQKDCLWCLGAAMGC